VADVPVTELVEMEAHRSWFAAGSPAAGVHVEEIGGAVCVAFSQLGDSTLVNRATGLGLARAASDADLDEIDGFFSGLGVRYAIALSPDAAPANVGDRLADRGFQAGYAWAKFRRGVDAPAAVDTPLHVERVSAARAPAFAHVVRTAWELPAAVEPWLAALAERPGWHCYVAFDGDEPAAAGAVFVSQGVAWLGLASTVAEQRRRGGQNAIMAARIRHAAALGCDVVVTETGEQLEDRPSNSYRNIVRNGFEQVYVRPNYWSPPGEEA
jgi:hypothetical protein